MKLQNVNQHHRRFTMKSLQGSKFKALLITLMISALAFVGCESDRINNLAGPDSQSFQETPAKSQPKFLKLKGGKNAFNKKKKKNKWVNKANGDVLEINHGAANSASGLIYGVDEDSPYNIYQINLDDVTNPILLGQLAFQSKAIAVHPDNGLVYYTADDDVSDKYYLATWDPATNTNNYINTSNTIHPCDKLAFAADGTLYGVDKDDKYDLYSIDTETGVWTLATTFTNKHLSAYGDFAFGPDGTFYNANGYNERFQVIDIATATINTIEKTGIDDMTGLATTSDGQMIFSDELGKIYAVDFGTADATYLGNTSISGLADLASAHFETELSYAEVSLEVLPNSIDADKEIEITLETTELAGGVAVVFQPHGTLFSPDAILNIVAHGVDFTGINPADVDIFYDNQETGQWEAMQRDDINLNVSAGTVTVVNARLPHFSRYGVAAD